ncbi:hypothetical protein BU15DRAFT_76993 [Melanogaster broomeanus]|nr:hypothetical protein BU15DRAFT_76993 [Melanogaster broomeanus]
MSDLSSPPFTFGTRLWMVFMAEAAAMSALAVSALLTYITYSAVTIQQNASRRWSTDTHIHYYFLNLMICDLLQAIGGLLSIKWIAEACVYSSAVCTVQGLLKHVGEVGVALSTTVITLHTLQVLAFRQNSSPKFARVILAIIWVTIALLVGIPNAVQRSIYDPAGAWCWIREPIHELISLQYMWMWTAALLNIVVYVFLALVVGRVIIIEGHKIRLPRGDGRRQQTSTFSENLDSEHRRDEGAIALQMLFYPAVYTLTVLPISAARFSAFTDHSVPFSLTAIAETLFALSGLLDVALYSLTRPKLMPQREAREQPPSVMLRSPSTRTYRTQGRPPYTHDLTLDANAGGADSLADDGWQNPAGSPDLSWKCAYPP